MALALIAALLGESVGLAMGGPSLTEVLMKRTEIRLRPVANPDSQVKVHVLGALYQIVDVDQRNNLATVNAYFDMWWIDPFLSWDPSQYNGTKSTYLPSAQVWVPELYLYHSIQGSTPLLLHDSAVQVHHTGKVRVFVPFTARALCPINVKYFPFDRQTCNLTFGSWSYKLENVVYVVEAAAVFLDDFFDNQEWILLDAKLSASRTNYVTQHHNESYSSVLMSVRMQRQSFYYVFNLVIPTTLVSLVALIGFHAPGSSSPRRETKFRLGIMTLLSMGVMLLMVVDEMPKFSLSSTPGQRGSFSDVPLLGIYYIFLICVISLGTITTSVFVLMERHVLEHPGCRPPLLLRCLNVPCPGLRTLFPCGRRKSCDVTTAKQAAEEANGRLPTATADLDRQLRFAREPTGTDFKSPLIPRLNTECLGSPGSLPSWPRSPEGRRAGSEELRSLRAAADRLRDVADEIALCRRALERASEGVSAKPSAATLTPEWRRLIRRLEAMSLAVYLAAIFTALLGFFCPVWY